MKKHRTNKEHLSATEIEAYLNASLSDTEMHHVEKHLLECDFCNEAMDGYASVYPGISIQKELINLSKEIDERAARKKKRWPYLRIAAIAFALIVSGLFITNYIINNNKNPQFSENKSTKKEVVKKEPQKESEVEKIEKELDSTSSVKVETKEEVLESTQLKKENTTPASSTIVESISDIEISSSTPTKSNISSEDSEMLDDMLFMEEIEADVIIAEKSTKYSEASGKLQGKVLDEYSKEPVPFASVIIKSDDSIITGIATNFEGEFNFDSLESANYVVEVSAIGYSTQSIRDVAISGNEITYQEVEVSGGVDLESVEIVTYNESSQAKKRSVSAFSSTVSGVNTKKSRSKEKTIKNSKAVPIIGQSEYDRYLADSLIYPEEAMLKEVTGEVVVKFTVTETGDLTNFEIQKSLGFGCDEEAIKLIQEGPTWNPAIKKGKPMAEEVKVKVLFE